MLNYMRDDYLLQNYEFQTNISMHTETCNSLVQWPTDFHLRFVDKEFFNLMLCLLSLWSMTISIILWLAICIWKCPPPTAVEFDTLKLDDDYSKLSSKDHVYLDSWRISLCNMYGIPRNWFWLQFWECSIPAANQEESELVLYVFDIIVSLWIRFLVKKLHLII